MIDKLISVRGDLADSRKVRGNISRIARAVGLDRRTVLAVLNKEHAPNVGTVDKLAAYFKKEARARRAAK